MPGLRLQVYHLRDLCTGLHQATSLHQEEITMDPWEMFSEMCRQVVENGNVYLDVNICGEQIFMTLWPYDDEEGDDE